MMTPDEHRPVRTDDELHDRWQLLLRDETFEERTLWVTWYDERSVQLPVVVPVDQIPSSPDVDFLDKLATVMQGVLGQVDGGWVSLALARPGSGLITSDDRAWADQVRSTLTRHTLAGRPLFLATSGRVRQLVLDDL